MNISNNSAGGGQAGKSAFARNLELAELLCSAFERFSSLDELWLNGESVTYGQLFLDAATELLPLYDRHIQF